MQCSIVRCHTVCVFQYIAVYTVVKWVVYCSAESFVLQFIAVCPEVQCIVHCNVLQCVLQFGVLRTAVQLQVPAPGRPEAAGNGTATPGSLPRTNVPPVTQGPKR